MPDKHISWTDHVRTVENKIAKNIGLLYRVSQFLDEDSLKTAYFLYIRAYLNETKLKRVYLKQKHAVRIVFNKDKLTHSKPLFKNLNALNVYQINIYQHLNFMHKFINNQIPSIFSDFIKRPNHKYPTNFSQSRFYLKRYSLNSTKYSISIRGPKLWNDVINKEEKDIQSYSLFQKKIRSKLIKIENETDYF